MAKKDLYTQPDGVLYEIGEKIAFTHTISHSKFIITSSEIKKLTSQTGESIYYQIYGIELDISLYGKDFKRFVKNQRPTQNDKELKYFATYGKGRHKFLAKTPEFAKTLMFDKLTINKQI